MALKNIDLNLLFVFHRLLMERRVSRVAETLELSQPAVSNALNQRATFDPATSVCKFTIGMIDLGEIYFLPKLMDELARVAPGVSISTVRNTAVKGPRDEMEAGHAKVDESNERKGIRHNVKLAAPHFVAVGHILSTSDKIATVPERYARECVKPFRLMYVTHPTALPDRPRWHQPGAGLQPGAGVFPQAHIVCRTNALQVPSRSVVQCCSHAIHAHRPKTAPHPRRDRR